jgi:hypothetical protein
VGPREAATLGTKEDHGQVEGLTVWKIDSEKAGVEGEVVFLMVSSPASSRMILDSSLTGTQSTRSKDAKEEGSMLRCLELAMIL